MDTKEKYRLYVNTHFLKKVQPIVIERALGAVEASPEARRRRSDSMRGETWAARVDKVREIVDRIASGDRP